METARMTEPSSSVPGEIADAEVPEAQDPDSHDPDAPDGQGREGAEIVVDEEKLAAWDAVKGDYEVEPGGQPVPNSMEVVGFITDNVNPDDDPGPDDNPDTDAAADAADH
jgi:hypothetical protein